MLDRSTHRPTWSQPHAMRPSLPGYRDSDACPCGSGRSNAECHQVLHVRTLVADAAPDAVPVVRTHGEVLASAPEHQSSRIAHRCGACGSILTVGLNFERAGRVSLICGCGARNHLYRQRP